VNYYNEIATYPAQWLRNLIEAGHIAPGEVDDRSIEEVQPADVGDGQAHFFAGIGLWSHALRLAGWPDDEPVWTGSCPCQPFSAAGLGKGDEDERHLWPEWLRLITECRPPIIFGEQVGRRSGFDWLRTVRTDMEACGYRVGAADLAAASVGAPHIRQRIFFGAVRMGYTPVWWRQGSDGGRPPGEDREPRAARGVADCDLERCDGKPELHGGLPQDARGCASGGMADPDVIREQARGHVQKRESDPQGRCAGIGASRVHGRLDIGPEAGATRGRWADAEWLRCTDGKSRPIEPGSFPLADGNSGGVEILRAYGNGIVPDAASRFIEAFTDAVSEL